MTARLDPDAAAEVMRAAGLNPLTPYPGADAPWPCTCVTCSGEVAPSYTGVKGGKRCRLCSKVRAAAALRGDEGAAIADMRKAGIEPLEPYRSNNTPWLGQCGCGRKVAPRLTKIRAGQRPCGPCARKIPGSKATHPVEPEVAASVMRSVGLEPLVDYPGNQVRWPCTCHRCGQLVETATYNHAVTRGSGCLPCGKIRAGFNRRSRVAVQAVAVMRQAGLEPLEDYPGTAKPWRCQCSTCEREVTPRLDNVLTGGGCWRCAKHGFNASAAAYVYLVMDPASGAAKIGICGATTSRLKWYTNHGWDLLARVGMSGSAARRVEKAVILCWRQELALPPFLSKGDLPYAGWTETVDADAISIPATIELITALAADEVTSAA